nr:hypothetical protein [uncultured Flavobacterium sp.]
MITAISSTYYIVDTDEERETLTGEAPIGKAVRCLVNETGVEWKRVEGVWSSSSGGVSLGESNSTAYRGDRGKIAYDHSQISHADHNAIIETQARRTAALLTI